MKNLKKFVSAFFVMAVCAMFAVSCGTPSVEEMVKDVNSRCPQELSNGAMTITKVAYEANNVVYTIEAEQLVDTPEAAEGIKKFLVDAYKPVVSQDPLLEAVVEQNLNLKFHLVGTVTQNSMDVVIAGSELK